MHPVDLVAFEACVDLVLCELQCHRAVDGHVFTPFGFSTSVDANVVTVGDGGGASGTCPSPSRDSPRAGTALTGSQSLA